MKQTIAAFCLLAISSTSFASSQPLNLCRQSAVRFVEATINLHELTVADSILELKDANEKSVNLLKVDKKTGDETYRLIYSAVVREIGMNMEGEWKLVADVTTTR